MSNYLNLGGTIRSQTVFQTLKNIKPLLSQFGITRIANVTGLDTLNVPVALSIRPNSKHLSVSQGKGLIWELAEASAIMESIECYHAENPHAPAVHGSYEQLNKNDDFINPNIFQAGFFHIKDLEKKSLGWIKSFDLVSGKEFYIPHALICLDSTQPHPEHAFFFVSTNGLASGNVKEEAICHAIYEVVERDSLYQWGSLSNEERTKTQLVLETVDSSINKVLLKSFFSNNIFVKVWDISSKVGIPAFHCVMRDPNIVRELSVSRGTGAHLSKEIALSRALTEAAQTRLTLITGSRDDIFFNHYHQQLTLDFTAKSYQGVREYSICCDPPFKNSFSSNIDLLVKQVTQSGFSQILIVDHTKAEFGIPVVHAFIPGMKFNGKRI